jgi:phage baseplate assembly protein gpV
MSSNIEQTPNERLDWSIDWTTRGLGSNTISSSSWAASSPDVTLSSPSVNVENTITTIYVTGGTPGQIYTITNTVTVSGGQILQETIPYICLAPRFA